MSDVENFKYLFRWIGAISNDTEIDYISQELFKLITLEKNEFPTIVLPKEKQVSPLSSNIQARAILFDLKPEHKGDSRCIHGSTIMDYLWECYRPDEARPKCAVRYDFGAWGPIYEPIVRYFKDECRKSPGTVTDLTDWITTHYPPLSSSSA